MDHIKISKFVSLILRHHPEAIGIHLDRNGWANVDELINGIKDKGIDINIKKLVDIVVTCDKQRFSFNEDKSKIRANQGHSIAVDVELEFLTPPDILYHGTSKMFLDIILKDGIKKQARNHVHLSIDEKTAILVGKRHGKPVVLSIDSKRMAEDGIKFYKSKNNVWLTDYISPKYFIDKSN